MLRSDCALSFGGGREKRLGGQETQGERYGGRGTGTEKKDERRRWRFVA